MYLHYALSFALLLSGLLFGDAEDSLGSHSSGYDYGEPHSGSGIDRSSGYGHSGSHGQSGGGHGHSGGSSGHGDKCCPLVVDPLCLAAILLSIAGASVLLARTIQIEITTAAPNKRSLEGKRAFATFMSQVTPMLNAVPVVQVFSDYGDGYHDDKCCPWSLTLSVWAPSSYPLLEQLSCLQGPFR